MNAISTAFVKQYDRVLDAEAEARQMWEKRDKEIKRLIRLSHMGKRGSIVVPISENRGVEIQDLTRVLKSEGKLFAPAFARRWKYSEVKL